MHQENRDVVELQFDDETLDAGVEVMETLPEPRRRQEGVGLLADDGHQLVDGGDTVLALERRVVAEGAGDEIRLVDHAGANGPVSTSIKPTTSGSWALMNSVI